MSYVFVKGRKGCELNELKMNWKWISSWMGMGIEPFSIHEWEWELIPIFSQWMGMGINSPKMMNGPKSAFRNFYEKWEFSNLSIFSEL